MVARRVDAADLIEAALAANMAWVAAVLAWSGDMFTQSRTFHVLAAIATEDHWAMVFWAAATVGVVGLSTPSRFVRLGAVVVLATVHGVVAACFGLANPLNTGTGTYAIIALLGYFMAWRRSDEAL